MKNKLSKTVLIGICLFSIYFIISNNNIIHENVLYAVNLWITKVFPSLFPMFIINDVLIYSRFPLIISAFLDKITYKLFKISGLSAYVFIMSIFSGTPANAIILRNLVNNKELTEKEASLTLTFSFFSNPLFLYTMLNEIFNFNISIKIILVHYLSNIIILILFRKKLMDITITSFKYSCNSTSLAKTINNAIKKSVDTLIMILGIITFYIILSTIILSTINMPSSLEALVKGLLEITQGLNSLQALNSSIKIKEIIAISIISFGGLSIHTQVINILSDSNIQYKYFFIGRILHVVISVVGLLII